MFPMIRQNHHGDVDDDNDRGTADDNDVCCVRCNDGTTATAVRSSNLYLSSSSSSHITSPAPMGRVVDNACSSSSSGSRSHSISSNNSSNNKRNSSDDDCDIYFRSILPKDRVPIQQLHEEWFPVKYQDEFYDDLVHNTLAGQPLYTTVAVACRPRHSNNNSGSGHNSRRNNDSDVNDNDVMMMDEETGQQTTFYSPGHIIDDDENDENNEQEDVEIAGCVVGSIVEASGLSSKMRSLLISDPTRHSRLFYIMTLGTVETYRNIGLASALIEDCIIDQIILQPPENVNVGTCYLHVITSNAAAIRFYEKLGFYRVLQINDYYDIAGEKHACFLYARYFHGNRGHKDVFKMLSRVMWSVWRHVSSSVLLLANNSHLSLGETIAAIVTPSSSTTSSFEEDDFIEP